MNKILGYEAQQISKNQAKFIAGCCQRLMKMNLDPDEYRIISATEIECSINTLFFTKKKAAFLLQGT